MKVQIPFQQLLALVKSLPLAEKAKLRAELDEEELQTEKNDDFINHLLSGPVYSDKEIATIEENQKSIAAWRAKS